MDKTVQILYGFIVVRILLLYLSTNITANIMSQIYTERVLINGEEPPVLRNTIFLFIIIDGILNILLLSIISLFDKFSGDNLPGTFGKLFIGQYIVTTGIIVILSLIISNTMYNKKYFLYKDDGLRAIRALQELMFRNGTLVSLIPFFMAGIRRT